MRAPRRVDLAVATTATAIAGALVLLEDEGWLDWLFGSVMLTLLGLLGRLGTDAWRSAAGQRRRATLLRETPSVEVARRAVQEERARLAREVESSIRTTLRQVGTEIDAMDPDEPVPALRRVHALARRTTSELRRQLGLLHDAEPTDEGTPPVSSAQAPDASRRALLATLAVSALAVAESTLYLLTEGPAENLLWSVVVTTVAAATLALRTHPVVALVVFAVVVALGSLVGFPVTSGFWIVVTVGVLVWTLAASTTGRAREQVAHTGVLLLLVGVVVWAFRRDDPSNLGVMLVVIAVAAAGGAVVAVQRHQQARAAELADVREQELEAVAVGAVREQRAVMARELHDVVSHAVGVIAIQAAAAELSWPQDPETVVRAIEVIRRTTADTLADLDRLPADPTGPGHTLEDLVGIVDRVRMAGTPVELTVAGDAGVHAEVVHRLVQETLTNAMRHAPDASVVVDIRSDATGTHVSVADDGPGATRSLQGGYGLAGLAERVALVGGTFECGTASGARGFRVRASLPSSVPVSTP